MKILHVITSLNTGGAEMMLTKLVAASLFSKEVHIVISLMDKGTLGDQVSKYAELYSLDLKAGDLSLKSLINLYRIIKQEDPDIIQGWMYHANIAALLVNFILRKKLVWNVRQSLVDIKLEKRLTAILIRMSAFFSGCVDKIIFNSHVSLSQHVKIGFAERNTVVIANGFDLDKFRPQSSEQILAFKLKYGLPQNSKIFGHVARYHPMKNHIGFIYEISKVLFEQPNLYCVMVGKGVSEVNAELVNAINNTNYPDRFIILGERHDLANIYGVFDFIVNSSQWGEAFPNVIGEAMACGTPCIVTDVGDSKYIVADLGFVYSPSKSEELNPYLNQCINMTTDEYLRLSISCRDHISKNYSINTIYKQYIQLYKKLLNHG
jgi:glycosyltransferase involved in cell wall biosynthesis